MCACMSFSSLTYIDPAGMLPESFHSNRCEPCPLGQAGIGFAFPHPVEGGDSPMEGQFECIEYMVHLTAIGIVCY